MSAHLLQTLVKSQRALIAALDGGDVEAVEAASASLQSILTLVRAVSAWREEDGTREQLVHALRLSEAGRVRAGYLGDCTRRKAAMVESLRRPDAVASYGRNGRYHLTGA